MNLRAWVLSGFAWINTTGFLIAFFSYLILYREHKNYLAGLSPERAEEILLDKGYPTTTFVSLSEAASVAFGALAAAFWFSAWRERRTRRRMQPDDAHRNQRNP